MDLSKKSGIYSFTCLVNNLKYIGSSIQLLKRKENHEYGLKNNNHICKRFQSDYNLYGPDMFIYDVIIV
jgi:hypothetical protein